MTDIHSGFQDVDATAQERAFFEFLDAAAALPSVIEIRDCMRACRPLAPGNRILDAGCGVGHQVLALAREVGIEGEAWGIDLSASLLSEARRRAQLQGGQAQVRFLQADLTRPGALPVVDLDLIRIERVLMYLAHPRPVLEGLIAALVPGGSLVAFEFDYPGLFVDHPDSATTVRWMQRVSQSVPSPTIGRQLPRLMAELGLERIEAQHRIVMTPLPMFRRVVQGTLESLCAAGEMSAEALADWWLTLEALDARGRFFAGFPGFVVSGHRQSPAGG